MKQSVLVTGGAGYVGSVLVPKLLMAGYHVKVLDAYIYGDHTLLSVRNHPNLEEIKGDLRDQALLKSSIHKCHSIIHLACISNDPSFELNPDLGRSINYEAFTPLVKISIDSGVKRFIFASSSSVYGIKDEENVTENLLLEPLTDYSKYKAMCEDILISNQTPEFTTVIVRPATVCGYSPRLRLDLTVNILTNHAVNRGEITVFGGSQLRPNIHIDDMANAYLVLLRAKKELISNNIFNAGYENQSVKELAEIVKNVVGEDVNLKISHTDDNRSYHISSAKIKRELGFQASYSIRQAVEGLCKAFDDGLLPNALQDEMYFNIKRMQNINLA